MSSPAAARLDAAGFAFVFFFALSVSATTLNLQEASPPPPWRIAAAGLVSLAVAMGIGRFAFTPLLPMMLHDGSIDLPGASWLATANYLGYLLGALLCTFQPWIWARLPGLPPVIGTRMARIGLFATCLLTLGMALPIAPAWPLLRFAAGLASALVFIFVSTWCLGQLARQGLASMGALIYIGPGAGISLSGLAASAMVAVGWHASAGWLTFALLATLLTALVWKSFDRRHALPPAPPSTTGAAHDRHGPVEISVLSLAYGLAGFGYIITATFLPVIARQAIVASPWLDMFWPIFGLGVMLGAFIASRLRAGGDLRLWLAGCYLIQAAGIGLGLASPSLAGFAIGSLLLGLPFTAITYFAMQEVRRIKPHAASAYMGLTTALYGLGQIAGPPMTALLLARSASARAGFDAALEIAAASLVLGALLFGAMSRRWPSDRSA